MTGSSIRTRYMLCYFFYEANSQKLHKICRLKYLVSRQIYIILYFYIMFKVEIDSYASTEISCPSSSHQCYNNLPLEGCQPAATCCQPLEGLVDSCRQGVQPSVRDYFRYQQASPLASLASLHAGQ